MSMPVLRLRQGVQFPANVYGDNGVDVSKANGNYTIAMDWSDFGSISTLPSSPTNSVLTFDTLTGTYVLVPSIQFAGGSGSVPSNANPLMDGTAAPGTSALYARGDHVHPTDTSRAPLVSPALTGTPTAPTAAPSTNTNQIATTAFVEAAVTSSGGVTPNALTSANDTNVTLALGGTPATAVLQATSITAGWSGTLATSRGGLGMNAGGSTGVPLLAGGTVTVTATTGSGNVVRANSPDLTGGDAIAKTQTAGDSSTKIATTAFVSTSTATRVAKAGDAMTGNLAINASNATLFVNKAASGETNFLVGQTAGVNRWLMALGQNTAEGGSNAGSDYYIYRCNDAGTIIDSPFIISRASGTITMNGPFFVNGALMSAFSQVKGQIKFDSLVEQGLGIQTTSTADSANGAFVSFGNHTGAIIGGIKTDGSSAVQYLLVSDIRGKPNRELLSRERARDIVNQLEVYDYDKEGNRIRGVGLIAQQAHSVDKGLAVPGWADGDWMIEKAAPMPYVLTNLQEVNDLIKQLTKRIEELEAKP